MKRVRYALGALGVAPALGLMIPAANATTAMTQNSGSTGKTVSMQDSKTPLATCSPNHDKVARAVSLSGYIWYSGTLCVYSQGMMLYHSQKGLTERTRFYSGGGALERTTWQAGKIFRGLTSFHSVPNMYAHEVCEALVANTNHNDVKYGPLCEKI